MNNDFGKEALSSCLFLADYHMARTTAQVSNMIAEVAQGIRDMIAQHEAELAKAQGEWVADEQPDNEGRFLVQLLNGSVEEARYDPIHYGCKWETPGTVVQWFKPATPPAPPPIKEPEPEIEVPPLHYDEAYDAAIQKAHKAAMREQALRYEKELAELRKRIGG
ncbi:hypothetical protein [Allohahella sp. A8]|uniref:hypothetical protein n=1 Tax=Allohahella sp. A8 TaxID=3141461 RepID=UPI003A8061F9